MTRPSSAHSTWAVTVLHAKIEANLRRSHPEVEASRQITNGSVTLTPSMQRVTKDEKALVLSPTEYAILAYMMHHPGEYIPFDTLFRAVWQRPSFGDFRALFVHITHLRQKLEDDPAHPRYIRTYMRSGYIFGLEN